MKLIVILAFTLISTSTFAQIGRHEQPSDTIPIGGETQERKETQMEAQDELVSQLVALRDSVNTLMSDKANMHKNVNLSQRKKQLDQMINSLKASDQNEAMVKEGNTLLHEVRSEINGQ